MGLSKTLAFWLLASATLAADSAVTRSAMVIHNIQFFEITHSNMLQGLRAHFDLVHCFRTGEVLNSRAKLYSFKKPLYDLVILVLPTSSKAMAVSEKLELLKYYDEGNPVMFLGHGSSVQSWRILLSQFGFDFVAPEGDNSGNGMLYTRNLDNKVFIPKEAMAFEKLKEGLAKGVVYEGGALSLTPYENTISWSLLEAPENALFVAEEASTQIIDRNKMNLVVAAQGETNNARIVSTGSFKMFSNQLDNISNGDNLRYFNNLIQWLQFKSQVLTIKNLVVCSGGGPSKGGDAKSCADAGTFRQNQRLMVKFQVFDEDGEFYFSEEGKLYVHVTKQVTALNQEPQLVTEGGEKYYVQDLGHFEFGVYKLTLVHHKPGFHFNWAENVRMINILPNFYESIELFTIEGLPFLMLIAVVMASAFNTLRLLLARRKNE